MEHPDDELTELYSLLEVDDTDDLSLLWQQAHEERQQARAWATRMRQAVRQWMRNQRNTSESDNPTILQQQQRIDDLEHDLQASLQHYLQREQELHGEIQTLRDELAYYRQNNNTKEQLPADRAPLQDVTPRPKTKKEELFIDTQDENLPPLDQRPSPVVATIVPPQSTQDAPATTPSATTKSRRRTYTDDHGVRHIWYKNGAHETRQDNMVTIYHANGDVQKTSGQEQSYWFAATQTLQRTTPNQVVWEYPNGQVESYTDQSKHVVFPDGRQLTVPLE